MAIMVQCVDQDAGIVSTIRVTGPYSPDVLDDVKARVRDLYRETLAFQLGLQDAADKIAEVQKDLGD